MQRVHLSRGILLPNCDQRRHYIPNPAFVKSSAMFSAEKQLSERRKEDKGEGEIGAAVTARNEARLALDCETVADGPLAQRRQPRPLETMIKICHYAPLTPL